MVLRRDGDEPHPSWSEGGGVSGRCEGNNRSNSCVVSTLRSRAGHDKGEVGEAERNELGGLRAVFLEKLNSSMPSIEAFARLWKSDDVRLGTCGD